MGNAFNIFAATFVSIGSFLFGYDSGIIASVITLNHFLDQFHQPNSNTNLVGAVVSTFTGGCFFGGAASGWLNDKFGRKRTIQIGSVFAIWGCSMQAGASNIATLFIGRIIAGLAIGCLSMTVPLYNTEIAPAKIRGFMVGLSQQMIGFGFIAANWVGYGCQFLDSSAQWRVPLALQIAPAAMLLVGVQFLPYSPRWLLEHGRDEEAHAVVLMLHSNGGKSIDFAEREYAEMHDSIKAELHVRRRHISDLWSTRAMLHRTCVACGVQIFGQFTGINVINYFGPEMYETLGFGKGKVLLIQGISGAIGPVANFIFISMLLDRVGRRRPLLYGAASIVVTFSILAAIVASFPASATPNPAAQRAGIAMIFLTTINFSLSFGPVSWVLSSEVFPTRIRSVGTSVSTCANWATNVLFSQVSPIALGRISWRYYLLFIALNVFSFICIYLFFPETKGKTLEEMAVVFGDQVDVNDVLAKYGDTQLVHDDGTNADTKSIEKAENTEFA